MSGPNLRAGAAVVVVGVATAAAVQSYSHIYDLGHTHGESRLNSVLLALSVDGLILAMSLLILNEAKRGERAPFLSWLMLWAGIGATVGANVLYGVQFGAVGWMSSAWPAAAFIGSVHAVMGVVRRWRPAPAAAVRTGTSVPVPGSKEEAARIAFEASLAAAHPLPEMQLVKRFDISRSQASKIRKAAVASAALNGDGSHVS